MATVVAFGVIVLVALSILCFAAYKIKGGTFTFSTVIGRLASLNITITSPENVSRADNTPLIRQSSVDPAQLTGDHDGREAFVASPAPVAEPF